MLKSDQQEKVLTTTTIQFKVNHEHFTDPIQKPTVWRIPTKQQTGTHFRNQRLMDPQHPNSKANPKTIRSQDPIQKPKSDGTSIFNQSQCHNWSTSETIDGPNAWHKTQVFFPGSDYTSYKSIGGKSQILTARILRRRKSRRRIGKP